MVQDQLEISYFEKPYMQVAIYSLFCVLIWGCRGGRKQDTTKRTEESGAIVCMRAYHYGIISSGDEKKII